MPKMSKAKAKEIARAAAKATAKPSRSRPSVNPASYTKICTVCKEEKLAEGNFFRVKAMADGYASRCKLCWNVRGVERPTTDLRAKADGEQTAMRSRIYPYRPGQTCRTHTTEEVRKIEKESGQKHTGWVRIGDQLTPIFGSRQPGFIDEEP